MKATNFLSFKELEYEFEDGVTTLVGENLTEEDQGSNGSGKSSCNQLIYYCLIGSSLRGSSDKKLIRYGEKEARASIDLYCPFRNETLHIERSLFLKSTSKLSVLKNDEPVSFATVKDGNDYILKWIGVSPEDIRSYFVICKEYFKSFFKASNTDRLALISRFINFNKIDRAKDIINRDITKLKEEKRHCEDTITALVAKKELQERMLEQERSRDLEREKEERINGLGNEISSKETEIERLNEKLRLLLEGCEIIDQAIKEKTACLDKVRSSLKEIPSIEEEEQNLKAIKEELNSTNQGQRELLDKQEGLEAKIGEVRSKLRKVMINLSGTITCPKCKHKFLTLKDTTLEEEQEKKESLGKTEKRYLKENESLSKELEGYKDVLSELISLKGETEDHIEEIRSMTRKINNEIDSIEDEIHRLEKTRRSKEAAIDSANGQIGLYKGQIESIKGEIERVKATSLSIDQKKIDQLIEEINGYVSKIDSNQDKVDSLSEEIMRKECWINRFKEFKMYLAIEQIKNIQSEANKVLELEDSDLRLLIEAFKKDSKGNLKDEITPYVVRDEAESFWYYSGGERAKVEVALIVAFQQMINSTNPYGGLEFLSLDEVTEGLSKEGLSDMISALDRLLKFPVFITTHVLEGTYLDRCKVLRIKKINGISEIVR